MEQFEDELDENYWYDTNVDHKDLQKRILSSEKNVSKNKFDFRKTLFKFISKLTWQDSLL